jgi:hypothetical protein
LYSIEDINRRDVPSPACVEKKDSVAEADNDDYTCSRRSDIHLGFACRWLSSNQNMSNVSC